MVSRVLSESEIFAIERPHPNLWTYYLLASVVLGPFFFVALIPLFFRYHTLRYRFDEEGVAMAWGILFRREVNLTYPRIQDIHLVSNVVERWLGLTRIQIQTASGSAKAEMTIEGIQEYEALRDFLYSRMRGMKTQPALARNDPVLDAGIAAELTATLREVTVELRRLHTALAALVPSRTQDD